LNSLPAGFRALVFGANGALGGAFVTLLRARPGCAEVVPLARGGTPAIDLGDEASLAAAAALLRERAPFQLIVNATGALHIGSTAPEKRLAELDPATLARAFAINAIGPALLIKHFAPLLPLKERGLFASLSARVGSIGDNRKGGWYSYRAAKAAQNMLVKTAAIEIARSRPLAVLAALHPGTVRSRLSAPIIGDTPASEPVFAAGLMLDVLDRLGPEQSGGFFAYDGSLIEW
jgi:NAD(P)-dependent dehydrogenase (short-subunit alcohol dehydrogenase family)